jgi:hypothetical protein
MSNTESIPPPPPEVLIRETLEPDQDELALASQERGADAKLSESLKMWGYNNEIVLLRSSSIQRRLDSGRRRTQVSLRLEAIPHAACTFIWVRLDLALAQNLNLTIHGIAPVRGGKRQLKLTSGALPKFNTQVGPVGLSLEGSSSTEQTIEYHSIVGSKLNDRVIWTFQRIPEDKAPLSFDTSLELDVEYLPERHTRLMAVVNLSARIAFDNALGYIPMVGRRTGQAHRRMELDLP